MLDKQAAKQFIDGKWDNEIVPELVNYIKIPNKSPMFDPQWAENGYMDQVAQQFVRWCKAQNVEDATVELVQLEGRTPTLFMEIPGSNDDCVLLYGHLDKQPEMEGWDEDLGPWKPVIKNDRLYGRGGADDGYATFASLTAIMALKEQNLPHARCVILIEGCEESGSYDLPYYVDHLSDRIGQPSLVVCLDSGAGNYKQLWLTTSLRGMLAGTLRVDILREGVHSGAASGIVPSSYRIMNQLLARLEDMETGKLKPEWFYSDIPQQRIDQADAAAAILGEEVEQAFPFVDGAEPMAEDRTQMLLNRSWRPTVSYTGMDGMPATGSAGNVLRPYTEVALSFRLPPTLSADGLPEKLKDLLESNPPNGAKVTFTPGASAAGWHAPPLAEWIENAVNAASQLAFDQDVAYIGEGGSIPFMGMLGEKFPKAQFVIAGLLGPGSNAHGPNEFLDIPMGKKLTLAVSCILLDHYNASQAGLTEGGAAVAGHRSFNEECC